MELERDVVLFMDPVGRRLFSVELVGTVSAVFEGDKVDVGSSVMTVGATVVPFVTSEV